MRSLFELPFPHATRRRRPPGGCRRACTHRSRLAAYPARWPCRQRRARAAALSRARVAGRLCHSSRDKRWRHAQARSGRTLRRHAETL